jgi:aminopeptidase
MGGAACVFGVMNGIIELGLKVNVSAFIPLAENMPSGKAVKPGDVVFACNGKSIEVENTDAEGRLILADALAYCSKEFNPKAIIDIATLTGAIDVALGSYASGLFCNNNHFASQIIHAGIQEDDVFWRMPLSKMYSNSIKSKVADLSNIGEKGAGACTAAAFLHEFVGNELKGIETMPSDLNDSSRSIKWAHIDMAGVMTDKSKMMSGRPVRALVSYFLNKQ